MKSARKDYEMIEFTDDKKSIELIGKIAERALKIYSECEVEREKIDIVMDLSACHVTCPLKLKDMLEWNGQADFMHDISGIYRHLNRETGELEDCFLPRFVALQQNNDIIT